MMIIKADSTLAVHAAKEAGVFYGYASPVGATVQPEKLGTPRETAAAHLVACLLRDLIALTDGKADGKYVRLPVNTVTRYLQDHEVPGHIGCDKDTVFETGLKALTKAHFVELWWGDVVVLKPCTGWHQSGAVELLGDRLAQLVLESPQ